MARKRNIINNTEIPEFDLEILARCFLSQILEYYSDIKEVNNSNEESVTVKQRSDLKKSSELEKM